MKILRSILILSLFTAALAVAGPDVADPDLQILMAEGERFAQTGNIRSALQAYDIALARAPHSPEIRLKLAGLQVLNGRYRESIGNFQRVISLNPDSAKAFVGMGIAYLHLGDYALARAAFHEALNLDQAKREDLHNVLDWIEARAGKGVASLPLEESTIE